MNISLITIDGKLEQNYNVKKVHKFSLEYKEKPFHFSIVYDKNGELKGVTWRDESAENIKILIDLVLTGAHKKLPQTYAEYKARYGMDEFIERKVVRGKSGSKKTTYLVYLPYEWVEEMGLDVAGSQTKMEFNGKCIRITKKIQTPKVIESVIIQEILNEENEVTE